MNKKTRHTLAGIVDTLGYLSLLMQWGWALILLLPALLKMESVQTFVLPKAVSAPVHTPSPIVLSPILTYTLVTVAFIIAIVGIYFAIKTPAYAIKTVDASAKKTATTIAHRTVRHPHNVREIRTVSVRILLILKCCAVGVGLLLTFAATYISSGLSAEIIVTIGAYLAIWPVIWFGLQYLVEPKKVTKK